MESFLAQIQTKYVYNKCKDEEVIPWLIIVVSNENGELIELKTRSQRKIDAVYPLFSEGMIVEVKTDPDSLKTCNPKFTDAIGELYSWSIHERDFNLFSPSQYVYFHESIKDYIINARKPAHVVGLFCSYEEWSSSLSAEGYLVKLIDYIGKEFQVIVWRNVDYDREDFPLFRCNRNSLVGILNARRYDDTFTLTTTYPPVVNPKCFSP